MVRGANADKSELGTMLAQASRTPTRPVHNEVNAPIVAINPAWVSPSRSRNPVYGLPKRVASVYRIGNKCSPCEQVPRRNHPAF